MSYKCHNCKKSFTNPKSLDNHKATKKHIAAVKNSGNVENITFKVIGKKSEMEPSEVTIEQDEEVTMSLRIENCMFCTHESEDLERY